MIALAGAWPDLPTAEQLYAKGDFQASAEAFYRYYKTAPADDSEVSE